LNQSPATNPPSGAHRTNALDIDPTISRAAAAEADEIGYLSLNDSFYVNGMLHWRLLLRLGASKRFNTLYLS